MLFHPRKVHKYNPHLIQIKRDARFRLFLQPCPDSPVLLGSSHAPYHQHRAGMERPLPALPPVRHPLLQPQGIQHHKIPFIPFCSRLLSLPVHPFQHQRLAGSFQKRDGRRIRAHIQQAVRLHAVYHLKKQPPYFSGHIFLPFLPSELGHPVQFLLQVLIGIIGGPLINHIGYKVEGKGRVHSIATTMPNALHPHPSMIHPLPDLITHHPFTFAFYCFTQI